MATAAPGRVLPASRGRRDSAGGSPGSNGLSSTNGGRRRSSAGFVSPNAATAAGGSLASPPSNGNGSAGAGAPRYSSGGSPVGHASSNIMSPKLNGSSASMQPSSADSRRTSTSAGQFGSRQVNPTPRRSSVVDKLRTATAAGAAAEAIENVTDKHRRGATGIFRWFKRQVFRSTWRNWQSVTIDYRRRRCLLLVEPLLHKRGSLLLLALAHWQAATRQMRVQELASKRQMQEKAVGMMQKAVRSGLARVFARRLLQSRRKMLVSTDRLIGERPHLLSVYRVAGTFQLLVEFYDTSTTLSTALGGAQILRILRCTDGMLGLPDSEVQPYQTEVAKTIMNMATVVNGKAFVVGISRSELLFSYEVTIEDHVVFVSVWRATPTVVGVVAFDKTLSLISTMQQAAVILFGASTAMLLPQEAVKKAVTISVQANGPPTVAIRPPQEQAASAHISVLVQAVRKLQARFRGVHARSVVAAFVDSLCHEIRTKTVATGTAQLLVVVSQRGRQPAVRVQASDSIAGQSSVMDIATVHLAAIAQIMGVTAPLDTTPGPIPQQVVDAVMSVTCWRNGALVIPGRDPTSVLASATVDLDGSRVHMRVIALDQGDLLIAARSDVAGGAVPILVPLAASGLALATTPEEKEDAVQQLLRRTMLQPVGPREITIRLLKATAAGRDGTVVLRTGFAIQGNPMLVTARWLSGLVWLECTHVRQQRKLEPFPLTAQVLAAARKRLPALYREGHTWDMNELMNDKGAVKALSRIVLQSLCLVVEKGQLLPITPRQAIQFHGTAVRRKVLELGDSHYSVVVREFCGLIGVTGVNLLSRQKVRPFLIGSHDLTAIKSMQVGVTPSYVQGTVDGLLPLSALMALRASMDPPGLDAIIQTIFDCLCIITCRGAEEFSLEFDVDLAEMQAGGAHAAAAAAALPRPPSKYLLAAPKKSDRKTTGRSKRMEAKARMLQLQADEQAAMLAEEWDQQRRTWPNLRRRGGWATVRVFISSTFNDMHGERDAITRTVFPMLNEMLLSRRVRAIPMDLRWGLTAEDTSDSGLGALEHCLVSIDECRPFFVVLSGERYGWRPPGYRVSDRPELAWVKSWEAGHSITAMEIFHGVLRKPFTPVHSFLYERKKDFLRQIDNDNERGIFAFDYTDPTVLKMRDDMKAAMIRHPYCVCRQYSCDYGGRDKEGKPHVTGLQDLEASMLHDLFEHICLEFPPPPPPPTPLAFEATLHTQSIEANASSHVPRPELLTNIRNVLASTGTKAAPPVVLSGIRGSGKTAMMCVLSSKLASSFSNIVITHIVGATPASLSLSKSLFRLCHALESECMLKFKPIDDSYAATRDEFLRLINEAAAFARTQDRTLYLLVDGIDRLTAVSADVPLDWLPIEIPAGAKVVVSCAQSSSAMHTLARRTPAPAVHFMPELTDSERRAFVSTFLAEYGKRLTEPQLVQLVAKAGSSNPLYLRIACDELRLQAQYGIGGAGVDVKIAQLPPELEGLVTFALDRVERDFAAWATTSGIKDIAAAGVAIVQRLLQLLCVAPNGLREIDLQTLVTPEARESLVHVAWIRLLRSLAWCVTPPESGVIAFSSSEFSTAARNRYLSDGQEARRIQLQIASYFRRRIDPNRRGIWTNLQDHAYKELVQYYVSIPLLQGINETLCNIGFVRARCMEGLEGVQLLLREYQDALVMLRTCKFQRIKEQLARLNMNRSDAIRVVSEFADFVGSHAVQLAYDPAQAFQFAVNQPTGSSPEGSATAALQRSFSASAEEMWSKEALVPRRWLEWKNKPFRTRLLLNLNASEPVVCCDVDPTGSFVLAGMQNGILMLADLTTAEVVRRFTAGVHKHPLTTAVFSRDGRVVIAGDASGRLVVWDVETGTAMQEITDHIGGITAMAWLTIKGASVGAPLVTTSSDASIRVWTERRDTDRYALEQLWVKDWGDTYLCLAYYMQSQLLLGGRSDGVIACWDAQSPSLGLVMLWQLPSLRHPVVSIAMSMTGNYISAALGSGAAHVWKLSSALVKTSSPDVLVPAHVFPSSDTRSKVQMVRYSRTSDALFLVMSTVVRIVRPEQWTAGTDLVGHTGNITRIASTVEQPLAVTASEDMTIKVWDMNGEDPLPPPPVVMTGSLPSGPRKTPRTLPSSSASGMHTGAVTQSCIHPFGRRAASGSATGEIFLWSIEQQDCGQHLFSLCAHTLPITALAFSPDGRLLVSGDQGGHVVVWDGLFYHQRHAFRPHQGAVTAVTFAPLVEVAYAGPKSVVAKERWTAPAPIDQETTGKEVASPARRRSVTESLTGLLLFTGSLDGGVCVWNCDTGMPYTVQPTEPHEAAVVAMHFVADAARYSPHWVHHRAVNEEPHNKHKGADDQFARLVTITANGWMHVWRTSNMTLDNREVVGVSDRLTAARFNADSTQVLLAANDMDSPVTLVDVIAHAELMEPAMDGRRLEPPVCCDMDAARSVVAIGTESGVVAVYDSRQAQTVAPLACFQIPASVSSVCLGLPNPEQFEEDPSLSASQRDARLTRKKSLMESDIVNARVISVFAGDAMGNVYALGLVDLDRNAPVIPVSPTAVARAERASIAASPVAASYSSCVVRLLSFDSHRNRTCEVVTYPLLDAMNAGVIRQVLSVMRVQVPGAPLSPTGMLSKTDATTLVRGSGIADTSDVFLLPHLSFKASAEGRTLADTLYKPLDVVQPPTPAAVAGRGKVQHPVQLTSPIAKNEANQPSPVAQVSVKSQPAGKSKLAPVPADEDDDEEEEDEEEDEDGEEDEEEEEEEDEEEEGEGEEEEGDEEEDEAEEAADVVEEKDAEAEEDEEDEEGDEEAEPSESEAAEEEEEEDDGASVDSIEIAAREAAEFRAASEKVWTTPQGLVLVIGCSHLEGRTSKLTVSQGIVPAAVAAGCLLADGGLQGMTTSAVGVAFNHAKPLVRYLGFGHEACALLPGMDHERNRSKLLASHTDFVLWRENLSDLLVEFVRLLAPLLPTLVVVVGGDSADAKLVASLAREQVTVLAVQASGGLADDIVAAKSRVPSSGAPSSGHADEIAKRAQVEIVPATNTISGTRQQVLIALARQRSFNTAVVGRDRKPAV